MKSIISHPRRHRHPGRDAHTRLLSFVKSLPVSTLLVSVCTGGGITSGIEVGFHILRRFGYAPEFIDKVAYIMEYEKQWELMKDDLIVNAA